jgi:hypothetical protein
VPSSYHRNTKSQLRMRILAPQSCSSEFGPAINRHHASDFILDHVIDEKLRRYWNELPNTQDRARITTRINPFLRSPTLSKVFGDPNARLNIEDVIRNKKFCS